MIWQIVAAAVFLGLALSAYVMFMNRKRWAKLQATMTWTMVPDSSIMGPYMSSGTRYLNDVKPVAKNAGLIPVAALVLGFLGATFAAHAAYATGCTQDGWYTRAVQAGGMPARWMEYAITASIMAVAIAALSGARDLTTLLCVAGFTAITMSMGAIVEANLKRADLSKKGKRKACILPSAIGWASMAAVWSIIGVHFFRNIRRARQSEDPDAAKPPKWITAIFWTQLALFSSFGVIQAVHVIKQPTSYKAIDAAYIAASFTAKTALAGLVIGGVVFANEYANPRDTSLRNVPVKQHISKKRPRGIAGSFTKA